MMVYCSQGMFAVYPEDLHSRSMHLMRAHDNARQRLDKYKGRGFTTANWVCDNDLGLFIHRDPVHRVNNLSAYIHRGVVQFKDIGLNFVWIDTSWLDKHEGRGFTTANNPKYLSGLSCTQCTRGKGREALCVYPPHHTHTHTQN
jgi:hypothetical protein